MPDFSGSSNTTDTWTTPGTPLEVLDVLVAAAVKRRGQIDQRDTGTVDMTLGSKFGYRMLGMTTPKRMMPMRLRIATTVVSAGVVQVDATVGSNQGWYAVSASKLSSRLFNKAFDKLFAALRSAAPPIPAG